MILEGLLITSVILLILFGVFFLMYDFRSTQTLKKPCLTYDVIVKTSDLRQNMSSYGGTVCRPITRMQCLPVMIISYD